MRVPSATPLLARPTNSVGPALNWDVWSRAVASGPVGPVLAGPTFGAGGCGKRQSARATRRAGGGEIES